MRADDIDRETQQGNDFKFLSTDLNLLQWGGVLRDSRALIG